MELLGGTMAAAHKRNETEVFVYDLDTLIDIQNNMVLEQDDLSIELYSPQRGTAITIHINRFIAKWLAGKIEKNLAELHNQNTTPCRCDICQDIILKEEE